MKNCSPARVARYKGIRPPACNGGRGCDPCFKKYAAPGGIRIPASIAERDRAASEAPGGTEREYP